MLSEQHLRAATCSGVASAINAVSSSEIRTDVRRRRYRRVPLEYETFMMTVGVVARPERRTPGANSHPRVTRMGGSNVLFGNIQGCSVQQD
ncbi:hypothetical protein Taro_037580 [Colocasia esculenta]|uniref:Uncharacterized protein n=1 Tax=Colocasia esculenta TaxID=4460 RepID=A0A843WJP6_COLES|nr:hypothetical protein [Colocasia esculenta]